MHSRMVMAAACSLVLALPASGQASEAPSGGDRDEVVVTAVTRPNLFGTVAIPGPQGRWADKWHKVMNDRRGDAALEGLVRPARGLHPLQQLRYLQAEIDRRVAWRSDTTQYSARTYWASAAETLSTGLGDDDDRAILKFQALRALGYSRGDYYLLMGRDRVRGDYVMLAARAGGRWWLLEEQGEQPVSADQRTGFEPAASFGAGKTFIHGRPRQIARSSMDPAAGVGTAQR